jgi:hypothetical protein
MSETTTTDPADTDATAETTASKAERPAEADKQTDDDTATDDAQTDGDTDDQADGTELARAKREAAARRVELKEARARIEVLEGLLEATRQSIVDEIAAARGLKPGLLAHAGHELSTFMDDGVIDRAKVSAAVAAVVREYRIAQPVKPNPQQGRPSLSYGGSSWAEALRER